MFKQMFGPLRLMTFWVGTLFLGVSSSVRADEPLAPTITLPLRRGAFGTYHFAPTGIARALVLFGSGDGATWKIAFVPF
jgi:hypothetical protein